MTACRYWLMKSEPASFSLDDLKRRPKQTEPWDGVRNYQARNFLRDDMRVGDRAFFYHSSCPVPGIAGIVEIVRAGYPDDSALDTANPHHDPRHTLARPLWHRVDVRYLCDIEPLIGLAELKNQSTLAAWPLLKRGNRLSVLPVSAREWSEVLSLRPTLRKIRA